MPNSVEAQGLTVEEAIQTALNQLGTSRERVEIKILHHPRSGFLGIGARRAKVRATLRHDAFQDGEEFDMSPQPRPSRRRRGRGGRSRSDSKPEGGSDERRGGARTDGGRERTDRSDRGKKSRDEQRGRGGRNGARAEAQKREPESQDPSAVAQTGEGAGGDVDRSAAQTADGERRQGRPRRRRGGRGRGRRSSGEGRAEASDAGSAGEDRTQGVAQETTDVAPAETQADFGLAPDAGTSAAASGPAISQVSEDGGALDGALPPPPSTSRSDLPVEKVDLEKIREQSWELVSELVSRMGFDATVEVAREGADQDQIIVKVSSPSEGLLIGRRGQTLDAMEHVLNRMVYAGEAAGDSAVELDIGGYRERRRQSLYDMATRLRDRSLIEQRSVQISPMGPRDRRVIQGVLGDDHTVKLKIIGTGLYRRIQITPAGMAETPVSREDEVTPDDNGQD